MQTMWRSACVRPTTWEILPCHCNGNTDPNMLFTDCHPLTGQCLSCMHNTAGPHCDICAPGYYGDAVRARNCTKCNCSPCGTESCDHNTGQCRCKPGVTGPLCDRCQVGFRVLRVLTDTACTVNVSKSHACLQA
uniref:Laminin EGF-like domain-containing protein n=1 Tax=Fundulus heteroclitus TaxID=8078 RepID=A0A3Q2QRQ9_FUNHE